MGLRRAGLALLLALPGCWPADPGAGVVTGLVTYAGKPAAGKRVALNGPGGPKLAATDAAGRYRFAGVEAGRFQLTYTGVGDDRIYAAGEVLKEEGVLPNEVARWRGAPFDMVAGSGRELPAIEVAYGGLLAPRGGEAMVIAPNAYVLFAWSAHPRARRYRVTLEKEAGAGRLWQSEWVPEPVASYGATVAPGRYWWSVELDGGEAGTGLTRTRQLDLSSQP